jgi:hypothetical protein
LSSHHPTRKAIFEFDKLVRSIYTLRGTSGCGEKAGDRPCCRLAARPLGRSLVDLVNTLQELSSIMVGFVSLSEALDLTTPSGRALAGMLAVFADNAERAIIQSHRPGMVLWPAYQ